MFYKKHELYTKGLRCHWWHTGECEGAAWGSPSLQPWGPTPGNVMDGHSIITHFGITLLNDSKYGRVFFTGTWRRTGFLQLCGTHLFSSAAARAAPDSSRRSRSGRVPVPVGRMVGCPTHPLNMSRESTLTHTEHVQIRFLHYLQAFILWFNSKHQKTYRLLFARLQQRCSLRSSMVGMGDYLSVFRVNKSSNFRGECLLIRARASTKSGWWAGSGPGSVCSPVSPPGSPAGFVPEPAGEFWRAPAQRELGLNERNCFQWRLAHAVCAWTSASASEEWTFCKAESWGSSPQFWSGHLQNQSLTGESEWQKMHRELLRATGLSPQVPGTGQRSAGRWRCRLGRGASGLRQHLQLSPCLLS